VKPFEHRYSDLPYVLPVKELSWRGATCVPLYGG
jgi:hypothetical protein